MTGNERKIKRKVQLIVASSMAVFFCLVLTLCVQLTVMLNQNATEKSLAAANAALLQEIQEKGNMHDFINSDRYIEEYILHKLGLGRPGINLFR